MTSLWLQRAQTPLRLFQRGGKHTPSFLAAVVLLRDVLQTLDWGCFSVKQSLYIFYVPPLSCDLDLRWCRQWPSFCPLATQLANWRTDVPVLAVTLSGCHWPLGFCVGRSTIASEVDKVNTKPSITSHTWEFISCLSLNLCLVMFESRLTGAAGLTQWIVLRYGSQWR